MAPHIATIPSFMIFVIVLAANLLGDALRDVLDPRLQS
jgi:ABC-type dipeptide/oligopeptide/nickel transport system permease subunit